MLIDAVERTALAAASAHFVQFYEHDAFLIDSVADFIAAGLAAGESTVVVATAAHRTMLADAIEARGIDLVESIACGRYIALDAAQTLASFSVGGWPDEQRFEEVVGRVIDAAAARGSAVRAFGEMVALLCERGEPDAAIELETMWNRLGEQRAFSLFCAYPMALFETESGGQTLRDVCRAHSHVYPAESFTRLHGVDEQARAIADLQRKANTLEAEIRRRQTAEDSLRRAGERKDEFLAMLSHELRNPLAPLTNALGMIGRREPLTQQGQQMLDMAQRQTRHLARLVDDLLEVSRISRGKIELRCEPMSIGAAVYNAVESVNVLVEQRRQDLRVVVPCEPLQLVADPVRVAQILENLLVNASKYTPEAGAIRLEVGATPDGVEIRVIDNGVGIEPARLEPIFELFSQIDATLDRSQGGLGIGLALVKRLVELHGGSVVATSAGLGRGSTFIVRLPRAS